MKAIKRYKSQIQTRCSYCKNDATGLDALGLYACDKHIGEADRYVEENSSRGKDAVSHSELPFEYGYEIYDEYCGEITDG